MLTALPIDPVSIHIVVPRLCVKTVCAPRKARIGSLKSFLPNSDAEFVFKGQLLNERNTIDFYNLKSNDSIVAIPGKADRFITEHWITVTKDSDTFSDSVKMIVNRESRDEYLRLRDLRAMRAEMRPRTFRRIGHQKVGIRARVATESQIVATVVCPESSNLSENPLPVCW
jgi:hypothetical protein